MLTYEQLKADFERRVAELQRKCKHPKKSGWITEYWAPFHPTGFEVRICKICNKVVDRRTTCQRCGRVVRQGDYVDGDGKTRPVGEYLCKSCEREWQRYLRRYLAEHPFVPRPVEVTVHIGEKTYKKRELLTKSDYCLEIYRRFMGRASCG